jgi:hypothetical protein
MRNIPGWVATCSILVLVVMLACRLVGVQKSVIKTPLFNQQVVGIYSTGMLVRPSSSDPHLCYQAREFLLLWNGSIRRTSPSDVCLLSFFGVDQKKNN